MKPINAYAALQKFAESVDGKHRFGNSLRIKKGKEGRYIVESGLFVEYTFAEFTTYEEGMTVLRWFIDEKERLEGLEQELLKLIKEQGIEIEKIQKSRNEDSFQYILDGMWKWNVRAINRGPHYSIECGKYTITNKTFEKARNEILSLTKKELDKIKVRMLLR